jgi:hydroxymethylpyrimidine/phosphomethylpyrimidine kinase
LNILSIGGSDPSSGAGIQNDIKTIISLDSYCFTVITAITSQNTRKFSRVEPVSLQMIKNQIDSIMSDFKIDAIKIGKLEWCTILQLSRQLVQN